VIERDGLAKNVREVGDYLSDQLSGLAQKYPGVIKTVRGLGFMLGFELNSNIRAFNSSDKAPSIQFVNRLHEAGLLAIPAGSNVLRLLPPLNLRRAEADEGLAIIESVVKRLV
jgi:acetylornithine/N-succinyldiaminopimelate aminotransferase